MMLPHAFRILAKDEDAVKAFVKKIHQFEVCGRYLAPVVGGLNTVGAKTNNYIFPLESDYKTLIDKFDAATGAAAGAVEP
jgi:hypothetical protein